jgi:hypothetical protein
MKILKKFWRENTLGGGGRIIVQQNFFPNVQLSVTIQRIWTAKQATSIKTKLTNISSHNKEFDKNIFQ